MRDSFHFSQTLSPNYEKVRSSRILELKFSVHVLWHCDTTWQCVRSSRKLVRIFYEPCQRGGGEFAKTGCGWLGVEDGNESKCRKVCSPPKYSFPWFRCVALMKIASVFLLQKENHCTRAHTHTYRVALQKFTHVSVSHDFPTGFQRGLKLSRSLRGPADVRHRPSTTARPKKLTRETVGHYTALHSRES